MLSGGGYRMGEGGGVSGQRGSAVGEPCQISSSWESVVRDQTDAKGSSTVGKHCGALLH